MRVQEQLNYVADHALPRAGPGEALVRNSFAGLNFHDTYTRSGLCVTQALP